MVLVKMATQNHHKHTHNTEATLGAMIPDCPEALTPYTEGRNVLRDYGFS